MATRNDSGEAQPVPAGVGRRLAHLADLARGVAGRASGPRRVEPRPASSLAGEDGPDAAWCLRLARRAGRPLAVIRIVADPRPSPREVTALLRCTDVVAPDPGGRHLDLVCPDTAAPGAAVVAGRLRAALAAAGREVRCGVATFPEDGFTLEDLLGTAASRARLVASTGGPLRPAAGDRSGLRLREAK